MSETITYDKEGADIREAVEARLALRKKNEVWLEAQEEVCEELPKKPMDVPKIKQAALQEAARAKREWEVRSIDRDTGGQKGVKLARFDLIPPGPLFELANHYGIGATKYLDRNWELGYGWGKSYAAMMRHAWAWWGGEDIDAETGSNHLTAVAWHAFALLEWAKTHPEKDDRPSKMKVMEARHDPAPAPGSPG